MKNDTTTTLNESATPRRNGGVDRSSAHGIRLVTVDGKPVGKSRSVTERKAKKETQALIEEAREYRRAAEDRQDSLERSLKLIRQLHAREMRRILKVCREWPSTAGAGA